MDSFFAYLLTTIEGRDNFYRMQLPTHRFGELIFQKKAFPVNEYQMVTSEFLRCIKKQCNESVRFSDSQLSPELMVFMLLTASDKLLLLAENAKTLHMHAVYLIKDKGQGIKVTELFFPGPPQMAEHQVLEQIKNKYSVE